VSAVTQLNHEAHDVNMHGRIFILAIKGNIRSGVKCNVEFSGVVQ